MANSKEERQLARAIAASMRDDAFGTSSEQPAHAAQHQNGGSDEINVAGLSGLLADPQTPATHAAQHQNGGGDAIKLDDLAAPDDNTDLNATASAHGLLPKLSGNASEYLNGSGAFSTPASGGITELTGDVTAGPGSGAQAATIANGAVSYAKIQDVSATDKLLGRATAGAGSVEEIDCTPFARTILDDVDGAAVRATIGAGSGDVTGPAGGTAGNFASFADASGKVIEDSGFSDADFAASAHSHAEYLEAANNLSDLASDDTAIANLVDGATSRVPALTDTFPYKDAGDATGGKGTIQQIFDRIDDLNTASLGLSSPIAAFESGGKKTTPTAIYNLINSLTAETAPVAADKVALYDASASQTDAVTIANLFGHGKAVVIEYTGSGVSGKTVTLTGINRAHFMVLSRDASGSGPSGSWPNGGTGTINAKYYADGSNWTEWSLSAPAAGTSQVLTINGTNGAWNSSGITYRLIVVGTPT